MGRAVLFLVGAYFMYTSMNAAAKWLGQYPVLELMFFRNLAALIPIGILVMRAGGPRIMRTRRPVGHALRASSALCAMFANYFSVALLPLGDAIALGNGTPLFITLLAIPMLNERPGLHRWGAVIVGMGGLLLIALGLGAFQSGGHDPVAVAVAASHGVFAATSQLLVRQLSATERSETIVAWQSLLLAIACGLALPFVWITPTFGHLLLMLLLGVCGGVGQFLMTQAYASAEASAIAPWTYSGIVWAVLLGWLIWGDVPGPLMILGSAIVAASGLYILQRERRRPRS
jgi:drug/metabolite transporter (DMT)-like permease